MELDAFRNSLDEWLDERIEVLAPEYSGAGTLDAEVAQLNKVKRLTYDAGWMRYGFPERVGELGGSGLLRAYLAGGTVLP